MVKINVRIIFFEDEIYLFYPKTNLVFEYNKPHTLVGFMKIEEDGDTFKLIKK